MAYNQYDLNSTSLVKTGILTEMYIPLWYYSSSSVSTTNVGNVISLIGKGSSSCSVNMGGSERVLHTLNSNWSPSQKFVFEASINTSNSSYAVYASLYDRSTNSYVTSSQISSTNTSFTVVRSGIFTLTPGHVYSVGLWIANSNGTAYLSKASLVAFLS